MTSPSVLPKGMTLLQDQELFEKLIGRGPEADAKDVPAICVVYFTANWCGACKRLDLERIVSAFPSVAWYKCDIDQNEYTAGFCGIRSIPTFLVVRNKSVEGKFSNSDTNAVLKWIEAAVA